VHKFDGRLAGILKVVQHQQYRVACRQLTQEGQHTVKSPPSLHVDRHPLGRHRSQQHRRFRHQRGEGRRVVT
jgi:hypothetical protein